MPLRVKRGTIMPKSLYEVTVNDLLKTDAVKFFRSPADWRDHWIYFLLVDRFDNPKIQPRHDEPCGLYQGGNFSGIKSRLKYLKELGVGAIWISPVLMNPPWFQDYWGGYGTLDFLRIEPRFCSDPATALQDPAIADREFRELVDAAHAEGIYVILDIVLNHVGDLFNYEGMQDEAPWKQAGEYPVYWRDEKGIAHGDWTEIGAIPNLSRTAGIWPEEFQRNDFFRRKGSVDEKGDITEGDFSRLKELVTEYLIPGTNLYPVRNYIIRAYQYLIAKFDLDGFRIDTLQYVETDFARVFGNAMREFALSIGKKNFFTFGEIWKENDDCEEKIARFVGRDTGSGEDFIGVDAALDFPMRKRLVDAIKYSAPPGLLAQQANARRAALKTIVSSHGDAGRYYITFLDNHDMNSRFHCPDWPGQTRLALSCLMTMQGIPCIYYGTEQGFSGNGDRREYVREALWRGPNAFSQTHELYKFIKQLHDLRNQHPPLRYGRQYFRPCSGNGIDFDFSPYPSGLMAFSRILNDREILIIANTSTIQTTTVHVVVDIHLNPAGRIWSILFTSEPNPVAPGPTESHGVFRTVQVSLNPMEAQVLG